MTEAHRGMGRKTLRHHLITGQGWRCAYCDIVMTHHQGPRHATIDHVIATSNDGADDQSNMVAACHRCNRMKANFTLVEIRTMADRIEQLIEERGL